MKDTLMVNGLPIEVTFTDHEIDALFKPLLKKLEKMHQESKERIICILAAPPGSGKTTTSLFLEKIAKKVIPNRTIQAISLDGFHYSHYYLTHHFVEKDGKKIKLVERKGSPETFNTQELIKKIETMKREEVEWPIYDRNLHDISTEILKITAEIVIIEGNWLLLNEEPWRQIKQISDYSLRIHGEKKELKERLIDRKIKGGSSRQQAENFYYDSDQKNIEYMNNHSSRADEEWILEKTGHFQRIER